MIFEEFKKRYAAGLTEQQLAAVTAAEGPTLLLAVPGSGKTTVLVTRIGYLILCKGIDPGRILTITYTVAATRDMKQRFASLFGAELAEQLEFRTINGICARIINYYARLIGKAPLKLVEEEKKTNGLLTNIYVNIEHTYPTESDLKAVRTGISYIKNMLLTQEEIQKLNEKEEFHIAEIYRSYCEAMRQQGWMDFDDQLRYALNILRQSPETLQWFRQQYPWVLVDEAQDTSRIQHVITAYLAGNSRNLFMVGDEDQSIYGFRAAYPQALLEFEQNYPGAQILLMETNFRSGEAIVQAADRFVGRNLLRRKKNMIAARAQEEMPGGTTADTKAADQPEALQKITLKTRRDQYSWLVNEAKKRHRMQEKGESCPQCAVLYRDNESALPLIDLLDRNGIPFQMRSGDWTFFSHRVVMDIRCFLAYALNPTDADAFSQIYYKMNLYLSRKAVEEAAEEARQEHLPVLALLIASREEEEYKKRRYREAQAVFARMPKMKPQEAIQAIVDDLGYGEYLQSKKIGDAKIYTLRAIAARETDIGAFLDRLDQLKELVQKPKEKRAGELILSTIHSSKGLEFDEVCLLDVIDGIFPETVPAEWDKLRKERNKGQKLPEELSPELTAYEEERRLFYVAITRAKERLYLFSTFQKSTFGEEIFPKEKARASSAGKVQSKSGRRTETAKTPDMSFPCFCEQFGEGVCVRHRAIGDGVVIAMDDKRITLLFAEDPVPHTFLLRILYEKGLLFLPE